MQLSDFLIIAVGLIAAGLTTLLWLGTKRRVNTEEHPVVQAPRHAKPARMPDAA